MPNYVRYRVPGGCYFFTVNLWKRQQHLLIEHVHLLREAFRICQAKKPFHIDAIVILPEHLHCIWTLPPGDDDFSDRWRIIKKHFSKNLPNTEGRSASRQKRGERGIWQRRFWEHVIRDEDDYYNHVNYIHYNPVKHGWVRHPREWPYSSYHRDIKEGTIPPEWSETVNEMEGFYGEI